MYERARRTRADTVSIGLVCTSSLCLHILILFSKRDFYSSSPHSDYYFDSDLPESRHEHSVWAGGLASRTGWRHARADVTARRDVLLRDAVEVVAPLLGVLVAEQLAQPVDVGLQLLDARDLVLERRQVVAHRLVLVELRHRRRR